MLNRNKKSLHREHTALIPLLLFCNLLFTLIVIYSPVSGVYQLYFLTLCTFLINVPPIVYHFYMRHLETIPRLSDELEYIDECIRTESSPNYQKLLKEKRLMLKNRLVTGYTFLNTQLVKLWLDSNNPIEPKQFWYFQFFCKFKEGVFKGVSYFRLLIATLTFFSSILSVSITLHKNALSNITGFTFIFMGGLITLILSATFIYYFFQTYHNVKHLIGTDYTVFSD